MRRLTVCIVLVCLLLSGCDGWQDGNYVSFTPHQDNTPGADQKLIEVSSYMQLRGALEEMVENGVQSGTISVEDLQESTVDQFMDTAVYYVTDIDPFGAYAVESIEYERGASGAVSAVAVTIHYNHHLSDLRSVRRVSSMESAISMITSALEQLESSIVLRVEGYEKTDFAQILQDYADTYPEQVMEVPQITVNTYPHNGTNCILEVQFTYQSNRESLRSMQGRVQDVFDSARLYVSGDGEDREKYAQLCSFLTERFEYQFDTSITPAYSLLCHGVGDSRAFATVYAAICHRAGLDCQVVSGTRDGEPWFWNIICVNGSYFHVDLIRNSNFHMLSDSEMTGYVWDYSAYPACGVWEQPVAETTSETVGG